MLSHYCYILSDKNRKFLYVGYTCDIKKRMTQHKSGNGSNFTKKYFVFDLIYFEIFNSSILGRNREKQLKNWHKEWKWNLVRMSNPELKTLEI
ncbi:putative endonuclease [Mariniflexile fucanivorans]|uniref:Putative endonuclease n=1 Tax=Mariniflexile fucanivorans TaxID=264023 RepID=A0A4R1RG60_9FLAO|nr:GIY-YIG nuclease family protein [Mariniflexile fucanivorans]TCL64974.1 putative endonuclease [Mariniflexile fucanivorans]